MLKKLLEKSKLRWCLSAVLVALFAQQVPAQEIDPRIEKVIADWKTRQERTKRVRYEASGEMTVPQGAHDEILQLIGKKTTTPMPPRDITSPIKETILIDFAEGRYRVYVEKQSYHRETDKLYPAVHTRLFDGKEIKAWLPPELNTHPLEGVRVGQPEIGTGKGDLSGALFALEEWPFFAGHGTIAWSEERICPRKLRIYPHPELLTVQGQGVHNGRPCLVLRTPTRRGATTSFDEYWVDTERESAVVRQLYYMGKYATLDLSIEYKPTDHGWLPKNWIAMQRNMGNGKPTTICRLNVDRLELEPSIGSSDFQIEEKPGMLISESYHPSRDMTSNGVPEIQTTIFRVNENGKRQVVSTDVPGRRWWWYLCGGMFALLALLGASWWWRRRKMRIA